MRASFPSWSGLRVLAVCLASAGCQVPPAQVALAPPPDPSPINGVGYVVLDAPITRISSALLIEDLDKLRARGARTIDLGINSGGGDFDAAETIVAEMDRLHTVDGITFNAYDLRLVASAATLIFLNAQGRYAAPRGAFVFHAPALLAAGTFSAETLRKDADQVDSAQQKFRDVLLARTRLTKPQIDVYVTRTVLLSAEDAQRDGVIDAVRTPMVPKGARAWVVKAKRKMPATNAQGAGAVGQPGATPS